MAKYTPEERKQKIKERRVITLSSEGFLPRESVFYSDYKMRDIRILRNLRARIIRKAAKHKVKNIPQYIKDSYRSEGFVDKRGRIDPRARHTAIVDQIIEVPRRKDRRSFVIPPSEYKDFKFGPRRDLYRKLIKNHFTVGEANKIIQAKTPKGKLQELNLNNPYWKQAIEERKTWYKDIYQRGLNKKMTHAQIVAWIQKEIRGYYQKDSARTPWDWLRMFSPGGHGKKKKDFKDIMASRAAFIKGQELRRERLQQKSRRGMLYKK